MLLQGIRVLDLTTLLPGPYATLRLADMGATVLKVEPVGGDPARAMGEQVQGTGVVFLANNRNKHSVQADLKSESGRDAVRALAREADVLVEGFRPGVATRLGVGYEELKEINPRLVYCSISGYGQTGSRRDVPGHDLNFMSASGLLSLLLPSEREAVVPRIPLADHIGGLVASEAILAALVQRGRTETGTYLDISIMDAVIGLLGTHALMAESLSQDQGCAVLSGSVVCYNLYRTKDGGLVSLAALEDKFWKAFCTAVGQADWLAHAFSPAVDGNPVYRQIQSLFARDTLADWCRFAENVRCCVEPVYTPGEVLGGFDYPRRTVTDLVWGSGKIRQVDTHAGGLTAAKPDMAPPPDLGRLPIADVEKNCHSLWESIKLV